MNIPDGFLGSFADRVQDPEQRLTLAEAEMRAAVSNKTLRRWIASGRLQAVKVGGRWLTTKMALFKAMFHVSQPSR